MEKIPKASSWNLPPTDKQVRAITRLAIILGYHEPVEERPSNRWEARNMIAGFIAELKVREELKRRRNVQT